MKMLVRKEVFEMLKIPMALVHLKKNTCKVFEQDEDGDRFWGAVLTGLNHTSCGSDVKFAVKEGDFTVTMALYDSDTYQQAYRQQPLILLITDILYVLLQIEGQDQVKYFFLSVEDCWGTPTADPNHATKHPLIMKG
ncbi:hypothetical protein JD844_000115 [Phrynosoma platyrhinos]|uniref:ZP-C domain-containing protein n=1 Tax=Phrynosoma platyrhinos TaxID=52577 RepID=A0ABQ7SQ35_PHRPL|nr:hypothetical protein JD844_000115 [Phrynosoma platyrhinos]